MNSALTVSNHQVNAMAMVVPHLSIVEVRGSDAIKVLGGLCTANLKDLPTGSLREAFFTDDRGRVAVHAMVVRCPSEVWILGQMHDPTALAAHIDRFIFREDAIPKNVSAEWFGLMVDGEDVWHRLTESCNRPEITGERESEVLTLDIEDVSVRVIRMPITGPNAWLCCARKEQRLSLENWLQALGFESCDDGSEFEQRRILNFWPVFGREITDRTLPQELDRDDRAISFNKGCYLGQETVARLDALGEVQKKLCLVRLDSDRAIPEGAALLASGKEVGRLTSIAPRAAGASRFALAFMRRGSFASGSSFQVGQVGDIFGEVIAHP